MKLKTLNLFLSTILINLDELLFEGSVEFILLYKAIELLIRIVFFLVNKDLFV